MINELTLPPISEGGIYPLPEENQSSQFPALTFDLGFSTSSSFSTSSIQSNLGKRKFDCLTTQTKTNEQGALSNPFSQSNFVADGLESSLFADQGESFSSMPISLNLSKTFEVSKKDISKTYLPKKTYWSNEETNKLKANVKKHGVFWKKFVQEFPGRNVNQLRKKWKTMVESGEASKEDIPKTKKRQKFKRWTEKDCDNLKAAVEKHGEVWCKVFTDVPGKTENQCRQKWIKMTRYQK